MPKYHVEHPHLRTPQKTLCGRRSTDIAGDAHPVNCITCCKALGLPRVTYRGVLGIGAGRFDTMPGVVEVYANGEWRRVSSLEAQPRGDGNYGFGMLGFEILPGDPETWVRSLQEGSQGYTLYVYQRPRPGSGFHAHEVMEYAALRVPDPTNRVRNWPQFELGRAVERLEPSPSQAKRKKRKSKRKNPRAKTVAKPTITVYDRILAGDIVEDL